MSKCYVMIKQFREWETRMFNMKRCSNLLREIQSNILRYLPLFTHQIKKII